MNVKKKILFDDVFFNIANTGIARLWYSIFSYLSSNLNVIPSNFEFIILNRSNKLANLNFKKIDFPNYDFWLPNMDRTLLTELARQEEIDLFVSSYYTFPIGILTLMPVYDLIPEKMGFNRESRGWLERELGFTCSDRYFAISESTKNDLINHYKFVDSSKVQVHYPGIDKTIFKRANLSEIIEFKVKHSLAKFALMVGSRNGYKNGELVFEAIKKGGLNGFSLVLVGGESLSEAERKICRNANVDVLQLNLNDAELVTCLSAANVLLYPSQYEGFGLPPLEALACGTPVVVMNSSSLPEAVGPFGIYMNSSTISEFMNCFQSSQNNTWIEKVRREGPTWAHNFTWEKMALGFLENVTEALNNPAPNPHFEFEILLDKYTKLLNLYQR